MSAPQVSPTQEYTSKLPAGLPSFLSTVVEHSLRTGLRRPEDFLRHFSPRSIMRSLAAEPAYRGRILEATTGLRSRIASKKSPESSAEDLQIALDEGITTPDKVVALVSPDDRVRFLDAQLLWAFVIEPGYGNGSAEHSDQIAEIREHTAFIIDRALTEGLISHRDVVTAISVSTLVDRLPRSELATVFERVLEEGREGMAFTDELLFQMVPLPVTVAHVPLGTLWNWVIMAKIAVPLGLMPEPSAGHEEDEALFDEREAHPDASATSKDVTVIIDGDGQPEVLLTNNDGLALIEHDGTVTYSGLRPTGAPVGFTTWLRPATVHDFDGDGAPEYAVSSANDYTVYESDASIVWTAPVQDLSGIAAGTAFDFLGDGIAEAMYTDEINLYVFDGTGSVLFQVARGSGTLSEYPVVADVDNDGSAEILFVSNSSAPTLQVTADVDDRWIQARRIWNQHAYHVTNVREDGTIPQFEPPSWNALNTFRTNAQIEGGGLCMPTPPG
ncbi:MAG: VCBS repeat-containing protein [Myxococcales bacterium]|nr:VCBS repeat-containing protein [Myxococcales bacterium]